MAKLKILKILKLLSNMLRFVKCKSKCCNSECINNNKIVCDDCPDKEEPFKQLDSAP